MNLPTQEECFEILKKHHTPQHIIKHSLTVNKVANYIAEKYKDNNININLDLIDRATLLHDVLRVCDIKGDLFKYTDPKDETEENKLIWQKQIQEYEGLHHSQAARKLFENKYPELAIVISKHRNSAILTGELHDIEEKIVYYSDKRVDHCKIVSLDQRMSLGKKRWNINTENDKSELILSKMKELEKEILDLIKIKPESINEIQK